VLLQSRASSGAPLYPTVTFVKDWNQGWKAKNGSQYKVIHAVPVALFMDCSTYSTS
jgi:hypothetical protein